jgi:hypothetical protein
LSAPPIHNPFFQVGFIVPDLLASMEEFQVALGIWWRAPIDAIVPTPRHADLLPRPGCERTHDGHH